jgi:hypothetical protein
MESSIREYDVFIITQSDKIYIGNIFAASIKQAKMKALALNSTQPIIKMLLETNKDYSVIAEISSTFPIYK